MKKSAELFCKSAVLLALTGIFATANAFGLGDVFNKLTGKESEPKDIVLYPINDACSYIDEISVNELKKVFVIKKGQKPTLSCLHDSVSTKDFIKLERSDDCGYVDLVFDGVLVCGRHPKKILENYVESKDWKDYLMKTKIIHIRWLDGYFAYKLADFPDLYKTLKKDKKCTSNETERSFMCKRNAPEELKIKQKQGSMLPQRIRVYPR